MLGERDTAMTERSSARGASRRWTVFVNQDGVLLCTTVRALAEIGLLERSLERERPVSELCPEIGLSGFGYLRVALRCLASQGWLSGGPALEPEVTTLRW